jgi:hypothetical protein
VGSCFVVHPKEFADCPEIVVVFWHDIQRFKNNFEIKNAGERNLAY